MRNRSSLSGPRQAVRFRTILGGMADARPSLVIELQRATHAAGLRLEDRLARAGVSQGEAHILFLLADRNAHTVGELQRHLLHRPSTLTGLLDRLEQRGWVTRAVNADDRRSFLVSVTATGHRASLAVRRATDEFERDVSASVADRDLDGFFAVARVISGD